MKLFTYKVTCSVCGGEGVAHRRHTGADWGGATFTHSDPRVCEAEVARQLAEKDARIAELEARLA